MGFAQNGILTGNKISQIRFVDGLPVQDLLSGKKIEQKDLSEKPTNPAAGDKIEVNSDSLNENGKKSEPQTTTLPSNDKNKIPTSSDNSSSEVDSPKDKTTVQPIENSNEENIPSELDSTPPPPPSPAPPTFNPFKDETPAESGNSPNEVNLPGEKTRFHRPRLLLRHHRHLILLEMNSLLLLLTLKMKSVRRSKGFNSTNPGSSPTASGI